MVWVLGMLAHLVPERKKCSKFFLNLQNVSYLEKLNDCTKTSKEKKISKTSFRRCLQKKGQQLETF